jgi:hypothetical protein
MTFIKIAFLLSFLYSLSLRTAVDDGRGIDPNGGPPQRPSARSVIEPIGGDTLSPDRGAGLDPNG